MAAFTREATCAECGRGYLISGTSVNPGAETEAPRSFRCECGGFFEAFVPGSVNLERLIVALAAGNRIDEEKEGKTSAA